MTLNLTVDEMTAVADLAARKDLNKTSLIRQALRLYVLIDKRLANGEKLIFEDEVENKKAEVLVI